MTLFFRVEPHAISATTSPRNKPPLHLFDVGAFGVESFGVLSEDGEGRRGGVDSPAQLLSHLYQLQDHLIKALSKVIVFPRRRYNSVSNSQQSIYRRVLYVWARLSDQCNVVSSHVVFILKHWCFQAPPVFVAEV